MYSNEAPFGHSRGKIDYSHFFFIKKDAQWNLKKSVSSYKHCFCWYLHMPTRALVSRANKPLFHLRMKTKELLLLMSDGPLIFLFAVMNFYVLSPHNYNPLVLQD